MAFFGFVNVYALRVNLSVAIVEMVNNTEPVSNHTNEDACPGDDNATHSNKTMHVSVRGTSSMIVPQ